MNGVDVNLSMVSAGMAWWFERYAANGGPSEGRSSARPSRRPGPMVGAAHPLPPWDHRKLHRLASPNPREIDPHIGYKRYIMKSAILRAMLVAVIALYTAAAFAQDAPLKATFFVLGMS